GSGMTQDEEYQAQMTEANEQVQTYLASLAEEEGEIVIELLTDQAALAAGATIYKVNCAQCHAADGGGMNGLGPNLTDKYWKNGGDFDAIVSVVQNGVSGTSMIPWSSQLRPAQIQEIASYVYSLEGTTPAVPKAPEGELFERSAAPAQPTSDTTAVEP
ncbi:MAG: c-type cytochrome, partial [Cyclobacteriaceae bacterium]